MTIKELANYRIRCGITMYALAKKMGQARQFINNIEKGNENNIWVSDEMKEKYAQAIHEILQEQSNKTNKDN
ncbi:MAG: helix-turn-helix domain-containing protein [Cellulosilyticaceae bacterium]